MFILGLPLGHPLQVLQSILPADSIFTGICPGGQRRESKGCMQNSVRSLKQGFQGQAYPLQCLLYKVLLKYHTHIHATTSMAAMPSKTSDVYCMHITEEVWLIPALGKEASRLEAWSPTSGLDQVLKPFSLGYEHSVFPLGKSIGNVNLKYF